MPVVGFSLVAGIFSLGTLLEGYISPARVGRLQRHLDWTSSVLLLGGPILLCAVGAAVSVVMTSKSRARDVALLVASGAHPRTLVAAAACEAFIHVATATLVGAAVVAASNGIVVRGGPAALRRPPSARGSSSPSRDSRWSSRRRSSLPAPPSRDIAPTLAAGE